MKKVILVLLLLIPSPCTSAQNYNCFTPGINRYFINADGYVRGMRIDSITGSGNNFVYHPYRTPRGEYWVAFIVPPILDSNGGSWLGKYVQKQPDGTFLFDNIFDDTVIIKSQCMVGDSWIFYSDSMLLYTASCTSIDTQTVLGLLDSVKTVHIICNDTSDLMHNAEFALSKYHGFYKVFDLYTFPYHNPGDIGQPGWDMFLDAVGSQQTFTLVEFHIPTYAELYDWNVGDVYFYGSNVIDYNIFDLYSNYLDTIKGKIIDTTGVKYAFSGVKWVQGNQSQGLVKTYYQDTLFYPNAPLISKMPEETDVINGTHTIRYWPGATNLCMTADVYVKGDYDLSFGQPFWFSTSIPITEYKEGVGLTMYSYYRMSNNMDYGTTLQYYKRGNTECGLSNFNTIMHYLNLGASEISLGLIDVVLYPNPVSSNLTIETSTSKYHLSLTNTLGQLVYSKEAISNKETIDVNSLVNGVYYLRIETPAHGIINKKVVVQK